MADKQTVKPEGVTDEALERLLDYLDDLRESGATNMFGARSYLLDEFPNLSKQQASEVLSYWMATFGDRQDQSTK